MSWEEDSVELRARWRRTGWHGDNSVGDMVRRACIQHPDTTYHWESAGGTKSAILHDIYVRSVKLGRALRAMGLQDIDVVASQLPNSFEATVTICAVLGAGLTLLPMVPGIGPADQRYLLQSSGAKVLVTPSIWRGKAYAERLAEVTDGLPVTLVVVGAGAADGAHDWEALCELGTEGALPKVDADQRALLLYTSGSTATPKGVQHSHNSILVAARGATISDMSYRPDFQYFVPSPVSHMAGIMFTLRTLIHASPMVTLDHWSAEMAFSICQRHKPARMTASTFFYLSLFEYEASIGFSGRWPATFNTGGATVPPSLIEVPDAEGRRGWRSYGSSEIPVVTAGNPEEPLDKRSNTEGRTANGSEIKIVDDDGNEVPIGKTGEILARGPQMFMGYVDPAATADVIAPGGWFRTGDLGRLDYGGYLTMVGRKKDIVIRGGENISSREVEEVLSGHPNVLEAACLSVPDPIYGERVCAVIRLKSSGISMTLDDIRKFFSERGVSVRKTPELLAVYQGEWPRTTYGKVIKSELLELVIQHGLLVREVGTVRAGSS